MPQDIKIWEIVEKDRLKEIFRTKLDLEERLENWLEKSISMISSDLLVIGRQIQTDFGGVIDILCLDSNGDIVIIELKRDKTPREITAQILDYASWAKDLSHERISEIAQEYLGNEGSLDKAFKERFGEELPEIINENHKMLVVASEVDSSSERIIEYLSDSYGVAINAITFQYFQENDKEFLSRVFLIEPSEAEYRIRTKSSSKRVSNLTYEELEEMADKNGVGNLYKKLVEKLDYYFDSKGTTRSSIAFIGYMKKEAKHRRTIFSILPGESNLLKGLCYKTQFGRFINYFDIDKQLGLSILPSYKKTGRYGDSDREYGEGYFKNENEINKFLIEMAKLKKK